MSAWGQKQTWRDQISMSALPPKADIRQRDQDVCFGPEPDINRTLMFKVRSPLTHLITDQMIHHAGLCRVLGHLKRSYFRHAEM
jgi:hypothetical protein